MEYHSVDPAYKTLLRAIVLIDTVLLLFVCALVTIAIPAVEPWHGVIAAMVVLLAAIALATFWVQKRYRLTGFTVQPRAVYFRTGALWHAQTVVTFNRIQHVEITQGPLERWLKVARLVIYTAGGKTSDLTVPGLPLTQAESIRDGLLRKIEAQPGTIEAVAHDQL
jgi:membrane protein YdbS with pleckstrin-like domain